MDAKKFGAFIAKCRKDKHMTQADLARILHVTDKAVSRWERGIGFPDINTIEPLANALNVTVMEIMISEKIDETMIQSDMVDDALINTLDIANKQRQQERKTLFLMFIIIVVVSLIVLYIDLSMVIVDGDFISAILFFMLVALPFIDLIGGIIMLIYSFYRKRKGLSFRQTQLVALLLLMVPIIIMLLLFIMVMMGGFPVPI